MKDRGLQALRLSEARSRALLDAIPDLMFRMARDGTYLEAAGRRESLIRPARGADRPHASASCCRRDVADRFDGGARAAGLGRRADDRVPAATSTARMRDFEARIVPAGNDEMMVDRPRLHRADAARGRALAPPRDGAARAGVHARRRRRRAGDLPAGRHRGPDRPLQRERRGALRLRRRRAGARQALVGRLPPGGEPRGRPDLLPAHERGRRAARTARPSGSPQDGRRIFDLGRRAPRRRRRGPPPLPDLRPGPDGARRAARRDRGAARLPLGGQPRDAEPARSRSSATARSRPRASTTRSAS